MLFLAGVLSSPVHTEAPKELIHKVAVLADEYHQDPMLVLKIAQCESRLKEDAFNDKNRDGSTDHGPLQINSIHKKEMEKLGLDIENPDHSLEFGFILLKRQGTQPWYSSKKCLEKYGVTIS